MAAVTSYTAERILDLLSAIPMVEGQQEEFAVLIDGLRTIVEQNNLAQIELNEELIPQLQNQVAGANNAVQNLATNVIPELEQKAGFNAGAIKDLEDLQASLAEDINGVAGNANRLTKTFYSDTEPPLFDEETDRALATGDTWYNTTPGMGNRQYTWTGAIWSPFTVEVQDFALTAVKFRTTQHLFY